ncbi:MAG TPA: protein-glutamate O-methyltransferase CheR [Polyangiaceae bacterium]|nr:protein-glutamate O-methyltransferase CheR [Polyangiaceae bacterium]
MAESNQPGELDAATAASVRRFTLATTELERLEMELLLLAIYRHHGFDFRSYAPASLHRRIRRHMENARVPTISRLTELILHDPSALQRLLHDLSVNVTAMFRDPSFFAEFRNSVVPLLRTYPTVRIWHAGCSTGEEVYAMSILLEEEGLYDRCRIYATDMDSTVLDHARQGIFPLSRMKEYTSNYFLGGGKRSLSDYFTAKYDGALFAPRLAKNVLFTQHNLAMDRGFSEFNVIICRNVLIYFDRALKDHTLSLFSDSFATLGVLCLGRKESLRFTAFEDEFSAISARERIYRRNR